MMAVSSLFGAHVVFAHPKGFELDGAQVANAKDNVARYGGSFTETTDMKEAFKDADIVYPKSWPSLKYFATPTRKPIGRRRTSCSTPTRTGSVTRRS